MSGTGIISLPPLTSPDDLRRVVAQARRPALWASPSMHERASTLAGIAASSPSSSLPEGTDLLVAIGGGTLIDRAKWAAKGEGQSIRLIAVPSLWGSGSEASKVVVLDDGGKKTIHVDEKLLPDARCNVPELAATVSAEQARFACGDTWAHALEGFFSPLASNELRSELARTMWRMLELPLGTDAKGEWFELSALACAGQAKSSVGLVHGIAHTIEHALRSSQPSAAWGHAKLCSVFLLPVLRFNLTASEKAAGYAAQHRLDPRRVEDLARQLHDQAAYAAALPVLVDHWKTVLRDVCTRTNVALVRPNSLEFFQKGAF